MKHISQVVVPRLTPPHRPMHEFRHVANVLNQTHRSPILFHQFAQFRQVRVAAARHHDPSSSGSDMMAAATHAVMLSGSLPPSVTSTFRATGGSSVSIHPRHRTPPQQGKPRTQE